MHNYQKTVMPRDETLPPRDCLVWRLLKFDGRVLGAIIVAGGVYRMEMYDMITEFISTVGFPIGACVAMYSMLRENQKMTDGSLQSIEKAVDSIKEAINTLIERSN